MNTTSIVRVKDQNLLDILSGHVDSGLRRLKEERTEVEDVQSAA